LDGIGGGGLGGQEYGSFTSSGGIGSSISINSGSLSDVTNLEVLIGIEECLSSGSFGIHGRIERIKEAGNACLNFFPDSSSDGSFSGGIG